MRPRVLIVGCGDVGQRTGRALAERGYDVFGLRRSPDALAMPVVGIAGDVTDSASLRSLRALGRFEHILITTAPGGGGEAAYRQTYLDGLANVLALFTANPPQHWWLASSTSVYHQNDGSRVDERSATKPTGYAGQVMLQAEAMLAESGMAGTVVRFGGIYGPGRLRLVTRLREGVMPVSGNPISNRIHSDDCAGVLAHLVEMAQHGAVPAPCYLAVDDAPTPLRDVCRWLAGQLGIEPASLQVQGGAHRGGNKYCSNHLLRQTGYRFLYPDYRAGFSALL